MTERTQALQEKNNDIICMMQNLQQGLFIILEDGSIHPEYAKFLDVIFNTTEIAGVNFTELLFKRTEIGADAQDTTITAVE